MTRDEQDTLAAEHVLGTLEPDERVRAEALAAADPGFAALIRDWERRLGELQAMVDPIEPPPQVWDKIRRTVADEQAELAAVPEVAPAPAGPTTDMVELAFQARHWRRLAAAAISLAAAMLVFTVMREVWPGLVPGGVAAPAGRSVAVLQQSAGAPAFLLTVDGDSKTFTVRRVGAAVQPGRSYELWLVSDKIPQPRSLGVIGDQDFTTGAGLAAFDSDIISKATYAVSLEPAGGSPTGVPTGPVLYVGNLVEATP